MQHTFPRMGWSTSLYRFRQGTSICTLPSPMTLQGTLCNGSTGGEIQRLLCRLSHSHSLGRLLNPLKRKTVSTVSTRDMRRLGMTGKLAEQLLVQPRLLVKHRSLPMVAEKSRTLSSQTFANNLSALAFLTFMVIKCRPSTSGSS